VRCGSFRGIRIVFLLLFAHFFDYLPVYKDTPGVNQNPPLKQEESQKNNR